MATHAQISEDVVRLYRTGLSGRQIAASLNVDPATVRKALLAMNEPIRKRSDAVTLRAAEMVSTRSLTSENVRLLFDYDPETGALTWAMDRMGGGVRKGDVAGTNSRGRIQVMLGGKVVLAHRLIWLWMTGAWPENDIDHINGDSSDNRWRNLRDVQTRVNVENIREARARNKCGLLGVTTRHGSRPYEARIGVKGRKVYLGRYATPEEAHSAYLAAKREMHEGCTI